MKIGSIVRQKWFVWLVAPLVGLVLWAGGYRLVQVHAAALPLKAPFSIDGVFYPSGFMGDGEDGKHGPEPLNAADARAGKARLGEVGGAKQAAPAPCAGKAAVAQQCVQCLRQTAVEHQRYDERPSGQHRRG